MEVFSGLSLGAQREEMAVFKGRGDTVSLHNYVSLVFTDLFSQDETMPALTGTQFQLYVGLAFARGCVTFPFVKFGDVDVLRVKAGK